MGKNLGSVIGGAAGFMIGGPMGAAIGAGIGGGVDSSNAQDRAIKAQKNAARDANQLQWDMYQQQRQDQEPWRQAGMSALTGIQENKFMNNWQQDPGYQFRMQQGMNAINASAGARGMRNSGATMKALMGYGQNLASQEYGNVYNREYGRLSALAGFGNQATQANAQAAGQYGQAAGSNIIGMGNAIGAANIAQSNQMTNLLGQGMGAYAMYAEDNLWHR